LLARNFYGPPLARLFFIFEFISRVFNTAVDNAVEKHGTIFVSDSASDGSALCTAARAGTFVVALLIGAVSVRRL
jgi:hypothetical protein